MGVLYRFNIVVVTGHIDVDMWTLQRMHRDEWRCESIEVWVNVGVGLWRCGSMEVWVNGLDKQLNCVVHARLVIQ